MRARLVRERVVGAAALWLCLGVCATFVMFAMFPLFPTLAQGQTIARTQRGGDFNPASTDWNGLSAFVAEAKRLGLRVETPRRWNWRQARVNIPIVIIAPRDEELTVKPLRDYVAAGGRVLLADDFGSGDRLWEAFGLESYRQAVPPGKWRKQRYIDVHRTLPHPHQEADFLLRQASYLFLNVPQWLALKKSSVSSPLLLSVPYRSNRSDRGLGGKVLWRVSHGHGKLIAFSDPSAFINQMIAYGDNHRFVRNILQYLSLPSRAKKIILLWGGAEWSGEMKTKVPRGGALSLTWWDAMTHFNSVVAPLPALYAAYPPLWSPERSTTKANQTPAESWARTQVRLHRKYLGNRILLVMLLVICLGGLWIRFAPMWSKPSARFVTPIDALMDVPNRFEEQLESYREGELNYLGPLILFKEEMVSFLLEQLSLQPPRNEQESANRGVYLLDQLELMHHQGQLPAGINRVMPQLERLFLQIPGRHQWGTAAQRAVTAKTLKMYYNTAMLCLRSMGLEEAFVQSRWQKRPVAKHKATSDPLAHRSSR